ncbi:MAG: hypothetical protein OH338_00470 [Candidatus Parvarchaeota archaeon]|nr:hypothetical protein [Candidatus Parvarchaeota archaeon]MCW1294609.1 hypothetical protein [Candidatus Parvarchaeum tengchongense]MCW1296012.1 hypothetical protein [Candidatus Parvarchaeum tengchongense]MCW1298916.1 hypothetical protein [Candidatus Parvarchaeum tengchongense]MCW1311890.1 hypothetical protein [Candidatus Parvarchaeum tengchongense]
MEKNDNGNNNKLFSMIPQMLLGMLGGRNKKFSFDLDNLEIKLPNIKEPIKLSGKITIDLSKHKEDRR